MFALIKSALVAVTAYLEFKRETALDDRIDTSRDRLRKTQEEIEALRDNGGPFASRRADWLRSDYKAEALHLAHLKTSRPRYAPHSEGVDGRDA